MPEEKKRRKGGADYLREKYEVLDRNFKIISAECSKWRKSFEDKAKEYRDLNNEYNKALGRLHDADYRIEFLLDHSPFWVRWMYKRHFAK